MTKPSEELTRDVAFIRDPDKWPRWPQLPVKRYSDGEGVVLMGAGGPLRRTEGTLAIETGYLWGDPIPPIEVRRENVWNPSVSDEVAGTYGSIEELVDDGWLVD